MVFGCPHASFSSAFCTAFSTLTSFLALLVSHSQSPGQHCHLHFKPVCPLLSCKSCWALPFLFAQTTMIFATLFIRSYLLLCCGDKTLTKANAKEKNSLLAYASTTLIITDQIQGRTQAGTRRQKVRQRPQKTTAYCIILHGFLTQLRTTRPELSQLTLDWAFSQQSINN